jgi:hypothetical protein
MTYPLQFCDETIQVEQIRSHYMDNDTLALMLYTTDGEPFVPLQAERRVHHIFFAIFAPFLHLF